MIFFCPSAQGAEGDISRMLQNTPCDELEDQQEGTAYYLAVAHKGNLSHVFIYI